MNNLGFLSKFVEAVTSKKASSLCDIWGVFFSFSFVDHWPFFISFRDENVGFAVQKGLTASRSHIRWFRHNDMEHLESLLIEQSKLDKKVCREVILPKT